MSASANKAVFLSYASQDAEAAKRICDALRAAGIEVWFDQSELVGGDAWDAKIRKQIKDCALLIPIISASTQARTEGYFRLEWRLADQRTHLMGRGRTFLLPVCIDDTKDADADVPDSFSAVQWTRLKDGETPPVFAERVKKLLGGSDVGGALRPDSSEPSRHKAAPTKASRPWLVAAIVTAAVVAGIWQQQRNREKASSTAVPPAPLSEARKHEAQARALIDDDPLAVRENFRTAYELCERAVALSPDDGEIWATMARAHCVLISSYSENSDREVALARSQAERAMRLAPHSIESGLAMASFEKLNNAGAAAVRPRLLALLQQAPADRRILKELVRAEWNENNPDASAARRWAEQANALPGGDAEALVNLAWVYWARNQFPEIEATLERALAIQPTSGAYHLKLMVLTVRGSLTGDQAAARAWLQQIPPAILREDRVAMIANQTLYYSRQPEEALKVLAGIPREILEEGRYFAPRGYLAGEALLMAGKPRAAEVEFRAAQKVIEERLALDARNSRLLVWHGRILARLGDRDGAARQFETARELGVIITLEVENLMLEGRNDDAIKAADALMVRTRTRWPALLGSLKANPNYDPLRTDPRFQQILSRGEAWMEEMYHPPAANAPVQSPAPASSLPARPVLAERAPAQPPAADAKSVAVLAFANLSSDKEQEYFSDGISEELLNVLAKVPGLKVTARTSAFYFKGKEVPIPEIAKQLGVAYVVEGSVRKQGEKVRITAQLIKAADGFHVWSDTFTRDLKDIFAVQDEIAGLIAQQLQLKLGATKPARAVDPEAHRLVLEGRHYLALRGEANFARSEEAFRAAVAIAPDLAVAHAGWAELAAQRGRYQQMAGLAATGSQMEEVERHAARALQLDSSLSEPHAALAVALVDAGRLAEADVEMERGIAANPNYGSQYLWRAHLHAARGRLDTALSDLQHATELDPLAFIHLYIRGAYLGYAGRWKEALPLLDRGASLRGERFLPLEGDRALARFVNGRREEALALARSILADPELLTLGWWSIGEALWILRQGGADEEAVRQGEAILTKLAPGNYLRGYVLCCLGRFEEGLPLLRDIPTIARNRFYFVPIFDPARETPAFKRLISEMKVKNEYALARANLAGMKQEAKQ